LSRESVLAALKAGAFYSTQGPKFERLTVDGSSLAVECSPVAQVRWRTFGSAGWVEYAPEGGSLVEATLPEGLTPNIFVRIELVDHQGKRAWSNPFFVAR